MLQKTAQGLQSFCTGLHCEKLFILTTIRDKATIAPPWGRRFLVYLGVSSPTDDGPSSDKSS